MQLLYRLGTGAYHLGLRVAARLGHKKADKWVAGRRMDVSEQIADLHARDRPILWMHAASLGEFEQGRPVLEALRTARPELAVVLTFFSPSGYERCRGTELAEVVAYLPPDSPGRAREWVDLLRPALAVFIKYEFWYYHLRALDRAGVPIVCIAATFRPDQAFFRFYGEWWRREIFERFRLLVVQSEADANMLTRYGIDHFEVAGDPRVDRTAALADEPFHDELLAEFTAGHPTLMAGSVWPPDVKLLHEVWPTLPEAWRLVLAPHQLDKKQINEWQVVFDADRYGSGELTGRRVLILDTVGILSRAYRYARIAYVGGGFGSGLHNTLEPMSYGLPVLFGPNFRKFPEAVTQAMCAGAFPVSDAGQMQRFLITLQDERGYRMSQAAQLSYIKHHRGAATRTARLLLRYLSLLLLSLPLAGQSWDVSDRLLDVMDATYAKCNLMTAISGLEWRPGLCLAATDLSSDTTASLAVRLEADIAYAFIASSGGVGDLDLFLRDSLGAVVVADTENDVTPVLEFTASSTGMYTLQLYRPGRGAGGFAVVGMLRARGMSLNDRRYRQASRQWGAGAGAVRAAGGANRLRRGNNGWCAFGFLTEDGEATLEGLYLPTGNHFVTAAGEDDLRNIDLLLARDGQIVRYDRDPDVYPMLDYRVAEPGRYSLRLEVEKAGDGTGLVLLGLFTN